MRITDLLNQTGGLQSLARELGIDQQQAASGAEALAPALLGGFQKRAQSSSSGSLMDVLGQLGGGGLLDQVLSPAPTDRAPGDQVLGQVFGSKDVSRTVAQDAAAKSGLDPALLKKMLPLLAMLLAGSLAKGQQGGGASGGLGGMLGGLLGGGGQSGGALGGLAGLLDADGNGNPLDDILRRVGR